MGDNRGVVYLGPNKVEVQKIADPRMETPQGRKIDHGVILKVVSTNICGSDQHMVRGRTTAPAGLVLGHEITGEDRGRQRGRIPEEGRYRFRSVQRGVRSLPHLQGAGDGRLPHHQW